MITAFKRAMRRATPVEVASRELAESELFELAHQSSQEYAAAMVSYHQNKSKRLRAFVTKQTKEVGVT